MTLKPKGIEFNSKTYTKDWYKEVAEYWKGRFETASALAEQNDDEEIDHLENSVDALQKEVKRLEVIIAEQRAQLENKTESSDLNDRQIGILKTELKTKTNQIKKLEEETVSLHEWNDSETFSFCMNILKAIDEADKKYYQQNMVKHFRRNAHRQKEGDKSLDTQRHEFINKALRDHIHAYEKQNDRFITLDEQILVILCYPYYVWDMEDCHPILEMVASSIANIFPLHPNFDWDKKKIYSIDYTTLLMAWLRSPFLMRYFNGKLPQSILENPLLSRDREYHIYVARDTDQQTSK